jgi:hypothetical protein
VSVPEGETQSRGDMYETMLDLSARWPYPAAFAEFAVLGMIGEWISTLLRRSRIPGGILVVAGKMLGWGILGALIRLSFVGFDGFTRSAMSSLGLPAGYLIAGAIPSFALCKSIFANLLFGPQMMLFHRFEDNLVTRRTGYSGMKPAIATLAWFWIPAHTFTFSLSNPDMQVALAALESILLGIILGLADLSREGGKARKRGRKASPSGRE